MLADSVAVTDAQVAAGAAKILIEGISSEYRARRDLVSFAKRGPALDVNIGLDRGVGTNRNIGFDHAVFPDFHAGADLSCGIDAGGGGDGRRRINRHGADSRARASLFDSSVSW